jgi:hypothetical protein
LDKTIMKMDIQPSSHLHRTAPPTAMPLRDRKEGGHRLLTQSPWPDSLGDQIE